MIERTADMTTIIKITKKCALCGNTAEYPGIASTNAFGSMDLDTRPPEMERSTMRYWIDVCPHCGYVTENINDDLDEETAEKIRQYIKTDAYLNCDDIDFKSRLSKDFYRQYLIQTQLGNKEDAFYAIFHAAWACDDAGDGNADLCRKTAVKYLKEKEELTETEQVVMIDMMRRAKDYEGLNEIKTAYEPTGDSLIDDIIAFEFRKAAEKDTSCYTVRDVVDD